MKRVLKLNGQIVIGDVMFRNASDKARALAEYPDVEDEYQPCSILSRICSEMRDSLWKSNRWLTQSG